MVRDKIIYLNDAPKFLEEDLVIAYGHFSNIHPGHLKYLNKAKKYGSKLIVALKGKEYVGGQEKYIFSPEDRAETLSCLSIVDNILILGECSLKEVISVFKPKTLILGKEYEFSIELEIIEAIKIIKKIGGKVIYDAGDSRLPNPYFKNISTSEIENLRKEEFKKACKKQNLTEFDLLKSLENWESSKIIVIGDLILDQYADCEAIGMSAEAPLIVVKELQEKNYIGGAAIVAGHIAALKAKCELLSVVGNDTSKDFIYDQLSSLNVNCNFQIDKSRTTTFKKRYVVNNQKIFRVSKFDDVFINKEIETKLINELEKLSKTADVLVISDFVYGVITDKVLLAIKEIVLKNNLTILGDLQCSSQVGQITKFKDFDFISPNEKEARIALQDNKSGIEAISKNLMKITNAKNLMVKLGNEGLIIYETGLDGKVNSQSFPALSANPIDVMGAGDSILASMAVGLASGSSIMKASAIACCIASLAVEQMGNKPITLDKLRRKIKKIFEN